MHHADPASLFAHTADGRPWEPLEEHLRLVAERARRHATPFGAGDEAYSSGLLHDLGKVGGIFQRRLRGEGSGIDHWTLGGHAALHLLREPGFASAIAIEGHHIGLQAALPTPDTQRRFTPRVAAEALAVAGKRLSEPDLDRALALLQAMDLVVPPLPSSLWHRDQPPVRGMLAIRMLFSALVDADFVETEAFMRGDASGRRYRDEGPPLDAAAALGVVRAEIDRLAATTTASDTVARMRNDLLEDCLEAAQGPPGTLTLTAPTGAGKTLAMLAFALAHAARHGHRRIVFAIPFLSIVEQTVQVYRRLFDEAGFPAHYVLEHHSLSDPVSREGADADGQIRAADQVRAAEARLLAENWDAPIIVTTNVQLLESLFAHRPRRCRKLHNLAGSVILFDEAQTLPPPLARPTLAALDTLARDFGCTVVFATATQPAFDHLDDDVRAYAAPRATPASERVGWRPREVVRRAPALFAAARRTAVRWRIEEAISWDELADDVLDAGPQALLIVNLKRHARALAEALQARGAPGLQHLSTNLCPAHRTTVLDRVRRRLEDEAPCILVSTQCVEAGVDVDFPRVYRALGPLDAIAQAAGRCNRSGRGDQLGRVEVFLPEDAGYPPGGYEQATAVTRQLVAHAHGTLPIDDPEVFRRYYRDLYSLTKIATGADDRLEPKLLDVDFPAVAKHYRLIKQDTVQVVVPWDTERLRRLLQGPFDRAWIRDAREVTVAVFREDSLHALDRAPLTRRGDQPDDWYLLTDPKQYDRDLYGLDLADHDLWIG